LASASKDGKVIIWNLKDYPSKVPNIAELRDHAYNEVHSVAFSPDGNLLASASADGTSIIQWIRTEFLAQKVCKRVKRNLPRLEWQQYVGVDIPYEILCPGLPILSTTEEKKQMR
jgi:WD40 repeat protein